MDQLQVHKTKRVHQVYQELRIRPIFNAAYSPDYNPAEGAIMLTKTAIKLERWRALQLGHELDIEKTINEKFTDISALKINKFI